DQFDFWVIDHTSSFDKPAAKNAIVTLVQRLPVTHDIAAIVRFIRHHDDDGITLHLIETPAHCPSKSVWSRILGRGQIGNPCAQVLQNVPGMIGAPIVHDDDLVRDFVETQLNMKMLHGGGDASFFIASWNNNRKKFQLGLRESCCTHSAAEISSQRGCASACRAISSRI